MEDYIGTKKIQAMYVDDGAGNQGYSVKYEDGYESWSPKEAFEKAYRKSGEMNFGHAIVLLKEGKKVARSGWNGVGLWLELQAPDVNSKMTLPYFYINYPKDAKTTPGCKVPWFANVTDVLADDWCIVDYKP